MENNVSQRLKQIQEYYNLSTRAFSLSINMTAQGLSSIYTRNQADIKLSTIVDIISTYKEIDLWWLLSGEGEMIKGQQTSAPSGNAMDAMKDRHIAELERHVQDLQRLVDMQEGIINSQRSYMKLNDGTDARPTIQNRLEKLSALIVALEEMMMLNQRLITEQEKIIDNENNTQIV